MILDDIPEHLLRKYEIYRQGYTHSLFVNGRIFSEDHVNIMCSWALEDLPAYAVDIERCWQETSGFAYGGFETAAKRRHSRQLPFILCRMEAGI